MDSEKSSPESVGFSSERLARIRPVMQSYVDQRGFSGISTMIARRGQVVHFEQVGWQDRESQMALSPDTIFRIYSMTKPIICTAFMILYEQGLVQLFDPVAKFLPAFGKVRVLTGASASDKQETDLIRPMTIRDLLTHTAGLTYHFLEDSPVSELYRKAEFMADPAYSLEEMIGELAYLPLAYQPGTRWHYSMAIDVVAHLIEVISGQPLEGFLDDNLFTPLGMSDTGFSVPKEKHSRIACTYGHPDIATNSFSSILEAWQQGFNERIDVEKTHPAAHGCARGGHGLFSTAQDYMRFAQMLLNRGELEGERILAPKIVDLMHMNHLSANLLPYEIAGMPSNGYGFGLGSRVLLNVAESSLPGSVGEFGWAGAAKTYYWVDPREELIGILMTQFMVGFDTPESVFQVLAYQALIN